MPCPSSPNTPTPPSSTKRHPANPQPSYLPPERKSPAQRASGIFSLFRVELCDFSRKMMYIWGIRAQTREFEQYIRNTGKNAIRQLR